MCKLSTGSCIVIRIYSLLFLAGKVKGYIAYLDVIRLKKLSQDGVLNDQMIYAVMSEEKPNQQEQIKFKREDLKKYFPAGYTDEQMRRDIIKGLELLKRQRERNRDAR